MDPHLALLQSNAGSLEFCTALAAIGRTDAALVVAAAAADSATAPETKNGFLALLARLLGSRRPTAEAATNRAVFGGAPVQTPQWPRPPTADPLALFAAAGQYIHPLSYAAAVVADRRRAREVGPAMAASEPTPLVQLLVEAVAGGGPTEEVARAFAPGAAAWLKKARAATGSPSLARPTLAHVRWAAAETCALFSLRRPRECWNAAAATLVALDSYMPRNRNATIKGALDYEAITVAAVGAHCIDSKTPPDRVEALVAALVRPRDTQFSSPLRGAFYFTACGHAYRHLARHRGEYVTIAWEEAGAIAGGADAKDDARSRPASGAKPGVGEAARQVGIVYNHETSFEAARKYIVAAATLPLDDPELPQRYDRVLWCLLLGGGVNVATLWPFLVARARAEVDLFTAPVAKCTPCPQWPQFTNGAEMVSRLFDFCMDSRASALLLPTFVEMDGYVYAADGFYPTVSKFVCTGDSLILPALRSLLRCLSHYLEDESAALVDLWVEVYRESHGEVPDDVADAVGEKRLRAVQTC